MISLRPVTSRLLARMSRRQIFDHAEVRLIAPPSERAPKSLLCLPDDPDRIHAHHWDSTASTNLALLRGDPTAQQASRAFRLQDVLIADGTLMTRNGRIAITSGPRRKLLPAAPVELKEGTFCSTYVTERYFGHWLRDGLTQELWAADNGSQALVLPTPPTRIHETGYRDLTDLHALHVSHAHVEELWLLEDHELSDDRVARMKRVRSRLRATALDKGPSHVFLSRGCSGVGRVLANEEALQRALSKRGFALLTPEKSTPAEIVQTLASARVVVSPEGSATAHAAMTMPEGATLVLLQPPLQFNMIYKSIADALDLRFAFTVGDVVDAQSFIQPTDRLERLLDLVERSGQAAG